MTTVVWEDPPEQERGEIRRFGRERSPLRKEVDAMIEQLQENQGRWARLYDFPGESGKADARRRAGFMARKGLSLFVRATDTGYSLYGRWNGVPEGTTEEEAPETERPSTFGE